jgi:hypothetical protein
MTEYLRPWKLVTLAIGLALLVLGAIYDQALDWDIPISIIMAALTYLTAPWSMRALLDRRWRQWPLMLFTVWFSVDGCYWLYWHFKNPVALEMMRSANFPASLSLYGLCGVIWLYRGSLRELLADLRNALHSSSRKQP